MGRDIVPKKESHLVLADIPLDLVEVTWWDAVSYSSWDSVREDGLRLNRSYGLLVYDGKDKKNGKHILTLAASIDNDLKDDVGDQIVIPKAWVKSVRKIEKVR